MNEIERRINLPDRTITLGTLDALMLDFNKPVSEQEDAYNRSIDTLRRVLDEFRFIDGTVGVFHEPHYARIPAAEFVKQRLVSEAGLSRIDLSRDEVWMSFETKKHGASFSDYVDYIKMSYVARYSSYEEMKSEIIKNALPGQEDIIQKALPPANTNDNHITLEEVYVLGTDFREVKKQLTKHHFHVGSEHRASFELNTFDPIELAVPEKVSARAVNRVVRGVLLPFLIKPSR